MVRGARTRRSIEIRWSKNESFLRHQRLLLRFAAFPLGLARQLSRSPFHGECS